jgi:hypothetical protein
MQVMIEQIKISLNIEILSETDVDFNEIPRITSDELSYDQFFNRFMSQNLPVIIQRTKIKNEVSENWFSEEKFELERLQLEKGHEVPVANCSKQYFDSHEKTMMKFSEFVEYWKNRNENDDLLYLKDFHLKQEKPELDFYNVPSYFASDWLNEFLIDNGKDDYRFIYIGPKNTW